MGPMSGFIAIVTASGSTGTTPAVPTPPPTVPAAVMGPCSGNQDLVVSLTPVIISDGPGEYSANMNCQWTLRSTRPPIIIRFNSFSTEVGYDLVLVYRGATVSTDNQVTRMSGPQGGTEVVVQNDTALVLFGSDGSMQSSGFEASITTTATPSLPTPATAVPVYTVVPPPPASPPASVPTGPCNGTVSLAASPTPTTISDGPGAYSSLQQCTWIITAGGPITVQFSSFATETNYDWVKVYNGGSTSSPELGAFSGSSGQTVSSSGGSLTVVFSSDGSVNRAGFQASVSSSSGGTPSLPSLPTPATAVPVYTVVPPPPASPPASVPSTGPCSGTVSLTASSTPTTISDGPGAYSSNMACQWSVTAAGPLVGSIVFQFTTFATESEYDFVRVYRGSAAASTDLLSTLSGTRSNEVVTVPGEAALVVFISDGSVQADGFEATVTLT